MAVLRRANIFAIVCMAAIAVSSRPLRAADLAQGYYRGRLVTYQNTGGRKLFEGDILLDHVTQQPASPAGQAIGVAYPGYLWPVNAQGVAEIPYIVSNGAAALDAALAAFNASFTGVIQFVPRGTQADYVNFDFDNNNFSGACESYVGHIGGEQSVGGSAQCNLGTLLHEMGHVVGLYHEQSRPDRDSYITVDAGNVIKGSEANFDQPSDNVQDLTLFDYASVMMYIPFAFSRNGGPVLDTIPPGMPLSSLTAYSAGDLDGVRRLYGAAPAQVTIASNPPGLTVTVDGAAVTTPQAFTWKLKSTHTVAVAANAQTVAGASYIFGRWNDNGAATHTITVSPGSNTLAAPKTAPAVTVYTANFVQLSAYTAAVQPAAAGSIAVSPAPQSYPGATGQFLIARQPVTLTPTANSPYQFVTWGGTSAPYSAAPKPDYVPDGGAPFPVTGYFSSQPITTVTTSPGGFYFTVDGNYYKAPQSFTADLFAGWGAGSTHTLTGFSPSLPYSINTRYVFDNWSDGGALSHSITVPAGASTITGAFTAQYVPIAYASPSCAATVTLSPASPDGFYTAGTNVSFAAKPATGWKLTGWTGDLTGKQARQTLAITDEELAIANYNATPIAFAVKTLSPASFNAGSSGGTVKILGTGFSAGNAVFVNNVYRASKYVSAKEIDVVLMATDLSAAGAFPIAVSSFPPNAPCGAYGALGFFVKR